MPTHIASDRHDLIGLAGSATTEFQRHHGRNVARPVLDCGVVQQQLVVLHAADFQYCVDVVACQCRLKNWSHVLCNPTR